MKSFFLLTVASAAIFYNGLAQDLQWAAELELKKQSSETITKSLPASVNRYAHLLGEVTSETPTEQSGSMTADYLVAKFDAPTRFNKIYLVGDNPEKWGRHVILIGKNNEQVSISNPEQMVKTLPWGNVNSLFVEATLFNIEKIIIFPTSDDAYGMLDLKAVGITSDTPLDNKQSNLTVTKTLEDSSLPMSYKPLFFSSKEKLSKIVNSPYQEAKPIISPDGQCLYFVRKNSPANIKGKKDDHDIYFAELVNGQWSNSRNIGAPLNDKYANGVCSVSPDGNTLLVMNAYQPNKRVYDGVSISKRVKNGWSQPEEQKIEGFHNLCAYQDYFLSITGDVMLMALQMEETYGDQDLYATFKVKDNEWTKPVNLGSEINTPLADFSPFLSVDNRTLYFASTGHKGYGESDIFCSHRLDDTWENWTVPENIGSEVNTAGWDGYFTISPTTDFAYFISRGSTGNKVIFKTNDQDVYRISLREHVDEDPMVIVSGRVLNIIDETPIGGVIQFKNPEKQVQPESILTDHESGSFTFSVPSGQKISINANAHGFLPFDLVEDFTDINKYTVIRRDIYLKPFAVGQTFQLNNLFFVRSKSDLLPESIQELEALYNLLIEKPQLEIELGGHTDNQGLESANIRLSRQRADAVRGFLIDQGISGRRLKSIGYGPKQPIASNLKPESRKLNRRVEIKILKF